jgi:hypothetical protein
VTLTLKKCKEDSTPACCHIHQPTEVAATQKRRCVGRKLRGHLSQVWEEPSPPNTPSQACPSRRLYRARQTNQTQQSHPSQAAVAATATVDHRLQRQLQRPWTTGCSGSYNDRGPTKSSDFTEMAASRSVSTRSNCKQFASGQHGQGSNCSTEVHDRVQRCCVKRS